MRRYGVALGVAVVSLMTTAASAVVARKVPLWPLLRLEATEDTKDLEILWPLLDIKQSPDMDRYWFLVLNSYRHRHGLDKSWNVLWPIGHLKCAEDGEWDARVFPLFFGADKNDRYTVLFPLLWWFDEKGEDDYVFFLLPWGRIQRSKNDYFNALTPLFWGRAHENRYGALLPIAFWSIEGEGDFTFFVFPFFRDFEEDEKSTTGFLPWWVTQRGEKQFANLFPVIWQKEGDEYKTFFAFPLYYKIEDEQVFFPLYWDFEDTLLVIPAYGKGKIGRTEWESIVPPFFIRWKRDDYREQDVFWPLVIVGEGPDRERLVVRPLYEFQRRRDYVQRGVLLNLAAMGKGGDRELVRVFPLYSFKRRGDRHDRAILYPLYEEKIDADLVDRRVATLLPIGLFDLRRPSNSWHFLNLAWWGDGSNGKRHGLYPLYSYFERENKKFFRLLDIWKPLNTRFFAFDKDLPIIPLLTYLFNVERHDAGYQTWHMPLDLFEWTSTPPHKTKLRMGTWFVFDLQRWAEGAHEFRLFTVFWDTVNRHGAKRSQGLWPLYTYKHNTKGGVNASFLDPLWFWGEATGEEEHVSALLKILDYRKKPNGDSRFSFLWRTYRRDKRGDTLSTEMFPFLNWEKSPDAKSFSFLWRVLAYEKRDGDRSLQLFFLPKIGL